MNYTDKITIITLTSILYLFIQTFCYLVITADMNISSSIGISINACLFALVVLPLMRVFLKSNTVN